ncbi:MAG: hypothetical protein WBG42_11660 [Cryomorphaceae bacterium]
MSTTNPNSIDYKDAKQMIEQYRLFPRPIVGSEDGSGQLIQLDELSFPKSALQVFVGIDVDTIRLFFAINPTGRDARGRLTFPSNPEKQTYTVVMAGVKNNAIVHSTLLDQFTKCPPAPVIAP